MAALLGVTVFKGMDPAELDRIEARSRMFEPRDGARIFADADAADAVRLRHRQRAWGMFEFRRGRSK